LAPTGWISVKFCIRESYQHVRPQSHLVKAGQKL
jgi:hypothetical protein